MPSSSARRFALAFCALCLAVTPAVADAKAKSKTRGARLKPAPAVTYADGQTTAQRQRSEETRLRRECKGRPNAGACLGYTR